MNPATNAIPETVTSASPRNDELARHIERVRAHRAELRESVAAVDFALESPIAKGGAWRERVRAAMAELAHDFQDHIDLTESPGGIYDRAKRSAPRLAGKVDRLLGLGANATRAEDRTYDIALAPSCPADVSSTVMGATPVTLLGFGIE